MVNYNKDPRDYVNYFLETKTLGELKKISGNIIKRLEDRKIGKNNTDFVCDDLPRMPNGAKVYTRLQRQSYGYWGKVLNIVKKLEEANS